MAHDGPSILIIDSHAVVASALALGLGCSGFDRVTTIDPDRFQPDGIIPPDEADAGDIALVGLLYGDGRTALHMIRPLADKGYRVVVMTVDAGLPLVADCLDRGAEAVLDKHMSLERLVEGLRHLQAGGCAMTADERTALLENLQRHESAEHALQQSFGFLTEREAEVLAALVTGTSPKQIAQSESISITTVRGHIKRVLSKLGVNSQREALALARTAGWPRQGPLNSV